MKNQLIFALEIFMFIIFIVSLISIPFVPLSGNIVSTETLLSQLVKVIKYGFISTCAGIFIIILELLKKSKNKTD